MSPTKASLARFHPSLLPRAKSAEPPRLVSKGVHGSIEQGSVAPGGTNRLVGRVAEAASEESVSEMNGVEKRQGLLATPRRRSQTPGEEKELAKKRQSSMNPGPRASPPEEARDEGTASNGTSGAQHEPIAETGITLVPDSQPQVPSTPTQSRPYVPTSGMGIGEDGEPSLPSTPSQLGLEPPQERPKGLLFSSPSRTLRRKGRSSAKSSPLKPPDVTPEHPNPKQKSLVAKLGPQRYVANTPKPPPPPEETQLLELQSRLNDAEKHLQDIENKVLRRLLVSSWQQEGSKEGKYTGKKNKEILQRSTKIVRLRHEILQIQTAQSIDHSEARPQETDRNLASTKPFSLTRRLAEFLPFSIKPLPPEPRPPSPKDMDEMQLVDLDVLQTATAPFTITTSNELLLSPTMDNDLLQQQDVTMSTAPQFLTCDLKLTANIITQQISQLDVQALSLWAEPELGSWLRQSREKIELTALGKGFGRYWEVAKLRGKCWIKCKQDFTSLIANAPESNSPLSYLGMQELVFARSNVQLKVTWRISLSDQGEVESHSSACPRFPAAWQQEATSELSKIGDAFMMLVEERGISEAIVMICKVVFPA